MDSIDGRLQGPKSAPRRQQVIATILVVLMLVTLVIAVLISRYPPRILLLGAASLLAGGVIAAALPGQIGLELRAGKRYRLEMKRRILSLSDTVTRWTGGMTAGGVVLGVAIAVVARTENFMALVGLASLWGSLLGAIAGMAVWVTGQVKLDRARLDRGSEIAERMN